ncbi:hypothetical protein BVC80_9057g40 [Macleaya cordata]|uniref:Uncharacterized protein n=1 Tax=Macleaya cordata TaxID=56857 RepID=A0A200R9R0_MACCD|nr:hypothetical protein BVC80_9057g40 [Macleaya cordata]
MQLGAKRERLRQSRAAAPDYISLDGGSNHGAAEGLIDEESEFQGRITLLGDKTDGVKKGVFESVDGKGIGPDLRKDGEFGVVDDDEEKIWEEEQFRNGSGKRMDVTSNRVSYGPVVNVSAGLTIGGSVGKSRIVEVMSISQQAEVATQALRDSVRRPKNLIEEPCHQ